MSSNRNLILGGLAAVAAGLGIYLLYKSRQSSTGTEGAASPSKASKPAATKKKVKKTKKPSLTREKLIALFTDITRSMQGVVMQLAQMEQQIKSQADVPDEELHKYMMSQFESAMKTVEKTVYEKYSTNETEVQSFAKKYEDDAEFKAIVGKLQKLYAALSGEVAVVEVPADLTMEKMITIMEKLFKGMTDAMENIVKGVREEHGQDASKEVLGEAIGQKYNAKVVAVRNAINAEFGITQEVLQSAMLKYQSDPTFAAKMEELTQIQKEKLVELGIAE